MSEFRADHQARRHRRGACRLAGRARRAGRARLGHRPWRRHRGRRLVAAPRHRADHGRRAAGDRSGDARDRGGRAARRRQRAAGGDVRRGRRALPSACAASMATCSARSASIQRLGEVGRISRVNAALLGDAGRCRPGSRSWRRSRAARAPSCSNVNADEVAGAIAAARGGRLLLLTDVPGVLRDGEPVATLTAERGGGPARRRDRVGRDATEAARGGGCRSRRLPGGDRGWNGVRRPCGRRWTERRQERP